MNVDGENDEVEEEKIKVDDDDEDEDVEDKSNSDQNGSKSDQEDKVAKDSNKKKKNPLAALQMLCDKTEKTPKTSTQNPMSSSQGSADPGAILAFSWACNQAVVNDSLLKCPFCETPFISKGAYRHHLSKMHFVKDGMDPSKLVTKTPEKSPSNSGSNSESKEENTQSKFAKYSQLAKQLSCSGPQ